MTTLLALVAFPFYLVATIVAVAYTIVVGVIRGGSDE